MPLKCPSCDSSEVEKIAIESEEGKQIQYNLQKYQKVKLPELYYTPSYRSELKNVFILHCKECNLIEIVDLKRKESILRTKLRKHRESRTGLALGFIIAGAFLFAGIFLVFWTEIYVEGVDIKLLDMFSHAGFTPELVTILIIVASGVFLFFFGTSILLIKIMRKWISLLEFTFKLHRMSAGDNQMYFFEYSSEREQTGFKATILRSFYGAILVLGIGILIIENFFTIPDLQQYMWTAAAITAFSILCAIPIIFIFLYVSPLITKEINLYFNN
nr:hypothetical protein [Candidatus Sigynarchaeota archaeon]